MKIIDNFNGKSGLLLNTVYYAMKYNDNVVMRDPNKRPCVLYISGENDVEETMQRELSYANAVDENGKGLPLEETVEKLREEKLFEGLWEKRILYRPKGSISTGDLDSIINEVEADGTVEVKILIYDYLKRIKPDYPTGDIRLDIGEANSNYFL